MDKDLIIMNNGAATLCQSPNHNMSAIDLAIANGHLAIKSTALSYLSDN